MNLFDMVIAKAGLNLLKLAVAAVLSPTALWSRRWTLTATLRK